MTRKEAYKRLCTLEGEVFNSEEVIDLLEGYEENGISDIIISSPDFYVVEVYINHIKSRPFTFVLSEEDERIMAVFDVRL